MSKFNRVVKTINDSITKGNRPSKIRMSRTFAISLKKEMMPQIEKHFIDGRMTVYGVPWEMDNTVRGYIVDHP